MHDGRRRDVVDLEQVWRQKESLAQVGSGEIFRSQGAADLCRLIAERFDARHNIVELIAADQWAHSNIGIGRIADNDVFQALLQRFDEIPDLIRRHEHTADRRALLPGLLPHIIRHFIEHHLPGFIARRDIRAHDCGIETIGLDVDADGSARMGVQSPQHSSGVAGAGKCKRILWLKVIEKIADRTRDERECAIR